jgi:group II intron reverse transcriptase/maturase
MVGLVKQIRVVIKGWRSLVKTVGSRISTERLCFVPYQNIFRYYPLNRTIEYCESVPACRLTLLIEIKSLSQGADHARINSFSLRQRMQSKCVLNIVHKNKAYVFDCSFFQKRCYACKTFSNYIERDDGTNITIGQDVRNKYTANQGDLYLLKEEIRRESKRLSPLLVKSIDQGRWPMLKYNKDIKVLVQKRQKYLALLSNQYGLRSINVMRQIEEWLCQVDLRVIAIETVYRSSDNLIANVDNQKLKRENLINYLDILKHNKLKFYKSDPIRRVFIPKRNGFNLRLLGIPTIKDRIVQTLFVQVLEPIIDPYADCYSFGYRKGRNAHQAIGMLSKLLTHKPKAFRKSSDKRYFVHSKFVINMDVQQFFDKISHEWLLKNYPFPIKFVHILKDWLSSAVIFQNEHEILFTGFPQGSIIGPSLLNYTLNGLEQIIIPSKKTAFDSEKLDYYAKKGYSYRKGSSVVKKTLSSFIVRYSDEFVIVVNDKTEAMTIYNNVKLFLTGRGLQYNLSKSKIIKWENNAKFDYLGFTFHYVLKKKLTKITTLKKFNKNFIRTGLYVYPSNPKVQAFKKKIKLTINENLNVSPFRLIKIINPIISEWGNYFGVGTSRLFSKLDYYIYYRLWRYLRRKFKKVSTSRLITRYFQGVDTPSGRAWQFHGIFNDVNRYTLKRKGSVAWVILLCKLNKFVPTHMLNPNKNLIESSYFISETPFNEYNTNIVDLQGGKMFKNFNNWSLLYKRQKGVCPICNTGLGYLSSENLEIHHVKKVADLDIDDQLLNDITNFQLLHISCNKTTLKSEKR